MFRGAIFDLDGTLLDSMGVWAKVDEDYFREKGIPLPEDYGKSLSGLSFTQSAEYTKKRFGIPESVEEIKETWTRMTEDEYALHVSLKPGAKEYLLTLKRMGVKLAVATALLPRLYRPCLARHGLLELFDFCCSTGDIGDGSKESGDTFRYAAEHLGLPPEDCAVFEDVLSAVRGAKKAGCRVYCVQEAASHHHEAELRAESDGCAADFRDMKKYHSFEGGRCVILTGRIEGDLKKLYSPETNDLLLAADAGWVYARDAGLAPDVVIGDFDSSAWPDVARDIHYHPPEKDDTDTMMAVKYGLAAGYRDFTLYGGLGGHLSHTLANLQALQYLADHGARGVFLDEGTSARLVSAGETLRISGETGGRISVFAWGGEAGSVSIRNLKYQVEDARLSPGFPLGVSNEFTEKEAEISVGEGTLLVITD